MCLSDSHASPDCACRILLVSGSLRAGSVNSAVVHTAQALVPAGVIATVYTGLGDLPHFNPDDDREPLPESVVDLRAQLAMASAVVFSTPEYAGSLPGSFKNLLDWTVGGGLYDKPVSWVNASSAPGAAEGAHQALRAVLTFTGTDLVEAACVRVPVRRDFVGTDGIIGEREVRAAIGQALAVLVEHVSKRPVQRMTSAAPAR